MRSYSSPVMPCVFSSSGVARQAGGADCSGCVAMSGFCYFLMKGQHDERRSAACRIAKQKPPKSGGFCLTLKQPISGCWCRSSCWDCCCQWRSRCSFCDVCDASSLLLLWLRNCFDRSRSMYWFVRTIRCFQMRCRRLARSSSKPSAQVQMSSSEVSSLCSSPLGVLEIKLE